jgi:type I restriction enzyme R subunit
MKFNEQHTVENHIIKFIQESLSYDFISADEFSKLREFENEYLIVPELLPAIKRINHITDETLAQSILREIKKIDTNESFLNVLRNGINMKDPETGKMRDYKVVDYENLENNHFVVTNQFYFEGNLENIRPDILIFLNGIPIVDIEAKSPTASSQVDYTKAIGQIKRYERNASKLFWSNCFNIATDGFVTVYGSTYAPKRYFLEWRDDELVEKLGGELEMTLYSLLSKERLLDIIKNFIVFDQEDEHRVKKICRYQQYRATNKILNRVKEDSAKRGLIWHTQGSGKSLTMFFTAWKLRYSPELENPKVFVLVDRIDLDNQIYNTFINCGGENVIRVTSRRDLERKIKSPERGIFISTMQKFSELGDEVKNLDRNIIVLSDEAHRDNEGISAINLRHAIPNAFYFGFTGTPIDKKTLNTHINFGEEGERYLDYYSIQQAIEDGATLPVTYEARLSKFHVDTEEFDRKFMLLTEELNDKLREELSKKFARKESFIKLDERIEAICRDIVEHYRAYVEPNGFKAQIVCYDRETTAKYKQVLDTLLPPDWSAVIYSPGDANTDTEQLRKYNTSKREQESLISSFKSPTSSLRFLLVCDMLLTGFDAPIEQVMYLDKPLRDHNLLQAIARTNRVYPNKGCGKIVDYFGITRNLHEALNFDESIVSTALIPIEKYKEEFDKVMSELKDLFEGIDQKDPSMENLRRCMRIFEDNEKKQDYFKKKYNIAKVLFEVLAPDPFLHPYIRQFEWYTNVYIAFLNKFVKDPEEEILNEYGEKMKAMIRENVDFAGITKTFKELKINDLYLLERLNKLPEKEKAIALEKLLRDEISINIDSDPIYIQFGERLNKINKEFETQQIDLAERIKRYNKLLEDIKNKADIAKEKGMSLREYGLYLIIQEFVNNEQDSDSIALVKDLEFELSHKLDAGWQDSAKREEFLKVIKQIIQRIFLKEYKEKIHISDFAKLLNRLVDIILKRY